MLLPLASAQRLEHTHRPESRPEPDKLMQPTEMLLPLQSWYFTLILLRFCNGDGGEELSYVFGQSNGLTG